MTPSFLARTWWAVVSFLEVGNTDKAGLMMGEEELSFRIRWV